MASSPQEVAAPTFARNETVEVFLKRKKKWVLADVIRLQASGDVRVRYKGDQLEATIHREHLGSNSGYIRKVPRAVQPKEAKPVDESQPKEEAKLAESPVSDAATEDNKPAAYVLAVDEAKPATEETNEEDMVVVEKTIAVMKAAAAKASEERARAQCQSGSAQLKSQDPLMKMFLQNLSGDDIKEFEIDPASSIADLVGVIQARDPPSENASVSLVLRQTILVSGETILKDDVKKTCLKDHGLYDGSVVTLLRHAVPAALTASQDGTAKVWNTITGECVQTFSGHGAVIHRWWQDGVNSAVFSSDGSSVLTASQDHTAKLWNTFTGECTQTFSGHGGALEVAEFSADESSVLTSSYENRLARKWSIATGECIQTFSVRERCEAVKFSIDERWVLARCPKTAKLWSTATGECMQAFNETGRRLNWMLLSTDESAMLTTTRGSATMWSATTGHCLAVFEGHRREVHSAVFSADGSSVLTTAGDGTAKIWSIAEEENYPWRGIHEPCSIVKSFPEKSIARRWSVFEHECTHTLTGHTNEVTSAVFSADGSLVITASDDRTAKVWSTATGECMHTLSGHEQTVLSAVFFTS